LPVWVWYWLSPCGQLAIDDFGTGYSSFKLLRPMPVEGIVPWLAEWMEPAQPSAATRHKAA